MTPFSIPIMTIRLLDLELPRKQYSEINFIGAAKDLLRDHQERTKAAGIDLNLFHNKEVTYSSIQLDRYQDSPEWTGYGEQAIETLWFWLALFRERHPELLQNSVVIQEHYTPDFCNYQKNYHLHKILLSKSVKQDLQRIRNPEKQRLRLKNYLYGNIQRFFTHIGYTFDKDQHFLEVKVDSFKPITQKSSTFREIKVFPHTISFSCNFRLPQSLRLGQSTALGYGKLTHLKPTIKSKRKLIANYVS